MDAQTPIRADHRFLKKFVSVTLGGKVEHIPSEFSWISQMFMSAGGAWDRIFAGAPQDIALLRRLLERAFEKGLLTKKQRWKAWPSGQ